MGQGKYTVLFYVSLACGVYLSATNIVAGVIMLATSAIYLVGGDLSKQIQDLKK